MLQVTQLSGFGGRAPTQWGTPTSRGTLSNTSAPTSAPITGVTIAKGSLICVFGAVYINTPTITCTDSAGNTYTVYQNSRLAETPDLTGFIAYARAATALAAGTITVAWGGGTAASVVAEVFETTGVAETSIEDSAARDADSAGADTTPEALAGTPTGKSRMFFAVDVTVGTSTTWSLADGWTTIRPKTLNVATSDACLGIAYKVQEQIAEVSFAPTTANEAHVGLMTAFKKAA